MLVSGLNPYERLITLQGPFNYPPPVFNFIFWMGFLPIQIAGPVWNILSLLALILAIYFSKKLFNVKTNLVWLIFIFTLPFFPTKFNLGNGQINAFLLFFVVLSFYLYKNHPKLSAGLLALAISIKLLPVIFLGYFLLKRDYRQILYTVFGVFGFFAITLLYLPWSSQASYYGQIFFNAFPLGGKAVYYNQSLLGFLSRTFQNYTALLNYSLSLLLLIITFRRAKNILPFFCLYLLLNPLAWQHHFIFAIPVIIYFGKAAIIPYFLIAWNWKNPELVPVALLSPQFYGVVYLWILSLWPKNYKKMLLFYFVILVNLLYLLMLLCRAKYCL